MYESNELNLEAIDGVFVFPTLSELITYNDLEE